MALNTTTSIKRASTVLGKRCEDTKKNMAALVKKVYGKAAVEMEKVSIPNIPGMKDDVLFAAVNAARLAGVDAEEALTFASKRFAQQCLEQEQRGTQVE